ncbi:hypothetical protein SEVIR_9G289200v4 [Setaria viridis]|nr:small heat shock protein, chloroplastic [Setaria italica]XP_034571743.1 small heat shock protein, chloroplastic-like [Setaria viridis]RCV43326.1 hypothetical protein SETIT_9G285000v2 [Setaria italica]TKV94358.1 hypothetical protein SEVIR_9G289200v2 [Setaria viridis]
MSMVTSCTLLRNVTAVRPAVSSGKQLQSGRPAAVASLSSQWRSRPLSVCCAINPKGEHNPKTDLHPFNIPAFVLVHPVSPREERWQVEEEPGKVNLWFEVPGQSKEDLAVVIDEDVLVIKKKVNVAGGDVGQRNGAAAPQGNRRGPAATGEEAGKEAAQDGEVIYARLLLPAGYNKEGVEAELKSGELRVSIAKIKEQARRKINIDVK